MNITENFNLKQYIYERRAEGMTDGRIAESLGLTEEAFRTLIDTVFRAASMTAVVTKPKEAETVVEKKEQPVSGAIDSIS